MYESYNIMLSVNQLFWPWKPEAETILQYLAYCCLILVTFKEEMLLAVFPVMLIFAYVFFCFRITLCFECY